MPRNKRWGWIAAFIVSLLFLLFMFLPGWMLKHVTGDAFIRKPLIKGVEKAYPVRLRVGAIVYRWGRLEIHDLHVVTVEGRPLLDLPVVRITPAWSRLLTGRGKGASAVRDVELIEPTLTLEKDAQGRWNVQQLLGQSKTPGSAWPQLNLRIRNANVRLPSNIEGIATGDIHKLSAEIHLNSRRSLKWQAQLQSSRDLRAWVWSEGKYDAADASGAIDLRFKDLSLALVEEMLKPRLGESLNQISQWTGRCTVETRVGIVNNALTYDKATIRLRQAGIRWKKLPVPLQAVNGQIEAGPQSIRIKNLRGRVGDGRVRIDGHADLSGKHVQGSVNLQTHNVDLALLSQIHPMAASMSSSGKADARLRLDGRLDNPMVRGELRLRNVSAIIPEQHWKLSHVDALARLDEEGINLRYARGVLNGARWNASGLIKLWKEQEWRLNVGFKRLDPKRFDLALPVSIQPLSGQARISGPLRAPSVALDIKTPGLRWREFEGRNGRVQGSYDTRTGRLIISKANLRMDKARIEAQGEAVLKGENRKFQAVIRGDNLLVQELPLKALVQQKLPKLGGRVDFELNGSGNLEEKKSLRIAGRLTGENGWIGDNRFNDLKTEFLLHNQRISLKSFSINQDKGRMRASGEVSKNGFRGDVVFDKLNLGYRDEGGKIVATTVSGMLRLKRDEAKGFMGNGWLDMEDLQRNGEKLGEARLKMTASDHRVVLDDSVVMLTHGSIVKINGAIFWESKQRPTVDLRLSTPRIAWETVEGFLPVKPRVSIDGKIQGEATLTGPLADPVVQGSLQSIQPEVAGRRFDGLEIEVLWKNHKLSLSKAQLRQGDGLLDVHGDVKGERLDLSLKMTGFPLRSLGLKLGGVPVQGSVAAEGTIAGSFKKPVFEGRVHGEQVNLAGLVVQRTEGGVTWKNGYLFMDDLLIDRGAQRLNVAGSVALSKDPAMDLRVKLEATRLNELLLIVGLRPEVPMDGLISGQLRLKGTVSDPEARLLASLDKGYIYGYRQIHGELDVEAQGTSITVHKLKVADSEGSMDASGEYIPGKKLAMKLNVDNLSLTPMVRTLNEANGLEGRIDLQADIATTAKGLRGKLIGRIREGRYREFLLPLTEFQGRVQDDILEVHVAEKDLGLTIQGEGPIEQQWINFLKLPSKKSRSNGTINWQAKAPRIEATLINKFLPQARFTEGVLSLDINARGTWTKPTFGGEIKIDGVKGSYGPLTESFNGLNGSVRFSGQKLIVDELSSKYGQGRASVSGEILFNGFMPSKLDLMVQTRRFYYESPAFEGLIDSHLQIGGELKTPLITGEAVINRARISIVSSKKIRRFDPRLNLRVRTGKDNYFRQFGLANLLVQGNLTIKGTMTRPMLEGVVTSNRGVVNLYGNSFRMVSAKAEFKPEDGYYPYLKAQAKTRASGVDILLNVDGWTGSKLNFQFQSSPERSFEEIVALLNWSEMTEKNGLSLIQGNMNTVMDSVFGSVFDQFRDVLHVDFFTVEQDRIMGPFRVNLGKSVSDDLYLSYSRILSEGSDEMWSLEYVLTPHISLLGEHSEDDGTSLQLNFSFNF